MGKTEYLVYCGFSITHLWIERFVQRPKGWFLEVPYFKKKTKEVSDMLLIMTTAVNAIAPVILMILLGYFLKIKGFLSPQFTQIGSKLVFKVCLPAMLFVNIYDIENLAGINWNVGIYCVSAALVIFVLGLITSVLVTKVPQRRGVVLQCTFRSNFAIIGLPLASAFGGAAAVAVAAIISAVTIPVYNILAVISLTMFLEKTSGEGRLKSVLRNIATNPLILGVCTGLVALGIRELQLQLASEVVFSLERDAKMVYTVLNHLKNMTTPLSLIVLGSQFEFSAVKGMGKEIVIATLWRTVLTPLLGLGGAILLSDFTNLLSCGHAEYPALIALFASPVAVSSAIMAESMNNDGQLAAQLVVWTSITSIATIFIMSCTLMYFGYLPIL